MKIIKYILISIFILTLNNKINCQIPGRLNLYNHNFAVGFIENSPDKYISNPAKLKFSEDKQLGISISPSMFGLSELNAGNIFYNQRINDDFILGSSIYGMGGELYNEFSAAADLAYIMDDRFSFGASAELSRLFIKDFSSHYNFLITLGSIISISDNLAAGISINNLLRQSYAGISETVHQQAIIGVAYKSKTKFIFEFAGNINLNQSSGYIFGIRKSIFDITDVKLSACTNPKSYSIDLKFDIMEKYLFNFNIFYDMNLGNSNKLFIYGRMK
jgi:hypothetical protein